MPAALSPSCAAHCPAPHQTGGLPHEANAAPLIAACHIGDFTRHQPPAKRPARIAADKRKAVAQRNQCAVRLYELGDGGVGFFRVIVFEYRCRFLSPLAIGSRRPRTARSITRTGSGVSNIWLNKSPTPAPTSTSVSRDRPASCGPIASTRIAETPA